jgi:hypothetical protein
VPELRLTEVGVSASQLQARLYSTPIKQFPENYNVLEQLTCQVAHMRYTTMSQTSQTQALTIRGIGDHIRGCDEGYAVPGGDGCESLAHPNA